jgi:hypothetical protein
MSSAMVKNVGTHAQVVVHVRDDPLHVMLFRLDRRLRRGEPELLVGVKVEKLGDLAY